MLEKRKLYILLILSNYFFICYGEPEKCGSFPDNTGISDGDTKSLTEMFVSNFNNLVQASEVLTDVFDISHIQPANFRNFAYDYIKASAARIGMESPECTANIAATPIGDHFETLEPSVMVKLFSRTGAKYLQHEGLLNPTNVASRAAEYADYLKQTISKFEVRDNPEWKLKALMDGFEEFLKSLDILVADKAPVLATTFRNEVKLTGLESRKASNF